MFPTAVPFPGPDSSCINQPVKLPIHMLGQRRRLLAPKQIVAHCRRNEEGLLG
jgi:hypothetical protein